MEGSAGSCPPSKCLLELARKVEGCSSSSSSGGSGGDATSQLFRVPLWPLLLPHVALQLRQWREVLERRRWSAASPAAAATWDALPHELQLVGMVLDGGPPPPQQQQQQGGSCLRLSLPLVWSCLLLEQACNASQ